MSNYLEILRRKITELFKDEDIQIFLFGSRARNNASNVSDIDIGVIPNTDSARKKLTLFKGSIEDLNIPYKIEVVNFKEVSQEFKEEALKNKVVWKY